MNRREELRAFIESLEVALPADFDDDTSLISSGLFDSLAVFNLVSWIEEQLGTPINPATLDIRAAWDSVRKIVEFVEQRRDAGTQPRSVPSTALRRTTPGLRIETFTAGDAAAVAELQTGLWSPDAGLNLRYLNWKYEENPYGALPRIYLAYDGIDLIGMRGFYPSRWEVGEAGRFHDVLVADDLLVREDRRNRGVVTALMQAALSDLYEKGEQYVLNLSGGHLTVLASLAMGWRSVGHLQPWGRSSRSHAFNSGLRGYLARLPYVWRHQLSPDLYSTAERNPFARVDAQPRVLSTRSGIDVTLGREPRASEMAGLVGRLGYDGRIRHVRDAGYLDWRYRNPLNDYRFFYVDGSMLRGYLVLKWTRSVFAPNPRVQIVDWEAEDEACLESLLDAMLESSACPQLTTWAANLGVTRAGLLASHGFAPVDLALAVHGCPCILVQHCNPDQNHDVWHLGSTPLLSPDLWDMRMIYSMAG